MEIQSLQFSRKAWRQPNRTTTRGNRVVKRIGGSAVTFSYDKNHKPYTIKAPAPRRRFDPIAYYRSALNLSSDTPKAQVLKAVDDYTAATGLIIF